MMMLKKIFVLLTCLISLDCNCIYQNKGYKIDDDTYHHMEYVMDQFMAQEGRWLGAKYQMRLGCIGGGLIDGINLMDLSFQL